MTDFDFLEALIQVAIKFYQFLKNHQKTFKETETVVKQTAKTAKQL